MSENWETTIFVILDEAEPRLGRGSRYLLFSLVSGHSPQADSSSVAKGR